MIIHLAGCELTIELAAEILTKLSCAVANKR